MTRNGGTWSNGRYNGYRKDRHIHWQEKEKDVSYSDSGGSARCDTDKQASGVPQTGVANITSLETKLSNVQEDLNSALQGITQKESDKFDLVFSILCELQTRQQKLEESVRELKDLAAAQGAFNNDASSSQPQTQYFQPPWPQQQSDTFNNAATEGGQACFTPIIVAMPQMDPSMMQYSIQQVAMAPAANPMQSMLQQMPIQYVSQDAQQKPEDQQQWIHTDRSTDTTAYGPTPDNSPCKPAKQEDGEEVGEE